MINVAVLGLGTMGLTHLDVYANRKDARVVAVADKSPDRLQAKAVTTGNIPGQAKAAFDILSSNVCKYPDALAAIHHPNVHLVDVCLTTPLHTQYVLAAIAAGKHVLVEKPLARTTREADRLTAAAKKSKSVAMCALCMRFWPGWSWLKQNIASKSFGRVLAASFRRVASHPGGAFYLDSARSGGAILDLHVHDSDFVQYCFGRPQKVRTVGYSNLTNQPDHVLTTYHFASKSAPPLVSAEGAWSMAQGFGFKMQYTVNFQHATAVFDSSSSPQLMLYQPGELPQPVPLPPGMGYQYEIAYLLDCIHARKKPTNATIAHAASAIHIVAAESQSLATRKTVTVKY